MNVTESEIYEEMGRLYLANRLLEKKVAALGAALEPRQEASDEPK